MLRKVIAAFALLALAGCTSWVNARVDPLAQPMAPRDRVRLCLKDECREVHAVRVVGDSVLAVPYFQAPDCDSCVVRYRRVDTQVQVRRSDWEKDVALAVLLTPLAVLMIGLSQIRD